MLEKRDQWLRLTGVNADLSPIRPRLEQTLRSWVQREVDAVRLAIPADAVRDIGICWKPTSSRLLDDWVRYASWC